MNKLYPNSGALFQNDKKVHERSPDFNGDVTLDVALLKELMEQAQDGMVKMRLSGWRKETSRGWFVSLKASSFINNAKPAYNKPEEDVPF